jgi:hypothetical protein
MLPSTSDVPRADMMPGNGQDVDGERIRQRVERILTDLERPDGIEVPEALKRLTEVLGTGHTAIINRLIDSTIRDPTGEQASNAEKDRKDAMTEWLNVRGWQSPDVGDTEEDALGEVDMEIDSS